VPNLNKSEILAYFEEINHRLALNDKHGEILIVGGAALALVFDARDSTYDIDAIFHPKEDMRKIIKSMAEDYNLHHDWLNDGVKGFITDKMKSEQHFSYTNLTVSSINAEGLLAMKLTSARSLTQDMEDSVFLMNELNIQSPEELFDILDKYTYTNQQTPAVKYFTLEAFERYQRKYKV